jgi:hypothetical protein
MNRAAGARKRGTMHAESTKPAYKPLLMLIVKRIAIFFLIIFLLSAFFWTVGSFRSFLEETQLMLLGWIRHSSLGLVLASAIGFVVSIVYALAKPRFAAIVGIAGYAIIAALGAAGLVLSDGLAALSRGIG